MAGGEERWLLRKGSDEKGRKKKERFEGEKKRWDFGRPALL